MSIKINNYGKGFRIISLALDEATRDELSEEKVDFVYVVKKEKDLLLLPDSIRLTCSPENFDEILKFNNFDVFELTENGLLIRKYNDKSLDNYFFITGQCNSNCIMCPSSEYSRKTAAAPCIEYQLEYARHIPQDTPHLTITGGEPFLAGEAIFPFFRYLKERFANTEFLLLTNGRIFSVPKFVEAFCENVPDNAIVAIPIHGSNKQLHDLITRTDGSFSQTVCGVKNLLKNDIAVEIRVVVSSLNVNDFDNIASLIIKQFKGISYVSVIAMEMTGTAYINRKNVWITYKAAFDIIAPTVRRLVESGVDVRLYNFPLCTVSRPFWALCEKSISDYKVRFAEQCDTCRYKSACSGVFAGTIALERGELTPIL